MEPAKSSLSYIKKNGWDKVSPLNSPYLVGDSGVHTCLLHTVTKRLRQKGTGGTLHWFPRAAVTNTVDWGQTFIFTQFWRSDIKVLAGVVSSEASLFGL